jgi:hypothetical protein
MSLIERELAINLMHAGYLARVNDGDWVFKDLMEACFDALLEKFLVIPLEQVGEQCSSQLKPTA